ncbi:MAG: metal ABC transporter permease [Rickettsiales bacterium]|jgi:zinc transport system permease protein|nr:metal ABC transporter permease [Rickettsiales bacterium]
MESFEPFLINAIIGGIGIAIIAGILGSFVLWKNMAYFGDALSHSALLGVTIGILFHINLSLAVALIAIIFALVFNHNKFRYSSDTTLGILSYSALSLAIILASYSKLKMDLMGYLFGDILVINIKDIYLLSICICIVLLWMYFSWTKLILFCVSEELLQVEGGNSRLIKLCFTLILALFIAISFKIVGVLLITAMLIIPAASSLSISRSPLQMIVYSIIIGCVSVAGGISLAIGLDLPSGPTIVMISLGCFIFTNIVRLMRS